MGSGHDPGRFELGFPVSQPLLNVECALPLYARAQAELNHKAFRENLMRVSLLSYLNPGSIRLQDGV